MDYVRMFDAKIFGMDKTFGMDQNPFADMFRTAAAFNARMAGIALDTANRNAELAHGWTRETIEKMRPLADPSLTPDVAMKRTGEIAAERLRAAPEHVAKFAEVAKTAQTQAVELMMETGRDVQGDIVSAAREATGNAANKAADAAKSGGKAAQDVVKAA